MKTTANIFSRVLCTLFLCIGLLTTGCHDDPAVPEQQPDEFERLAAQQNTNISSLQTIVTALLDNDYVRDVSPISEDDKVLGHAITFGRNGTVAIYDINCGNVPAMGVKRDADGIWYWTIDGGWLLDSKGDKVRASAADGVPDQSGVTPVLKIVDGYWYVSYDGGKTWEEGTLGQVTGGDGGAMFAEVTYDEDYLYVTMAYGEQLLLPRTPMDQGEDGESGGEVDSVCPVKFELTETTSSTVTFTGVITDVDSLSYIEKISVYYAETFETFSIIDAQSTSIYEINSDNTVSITVKELAYDTSYDYCLYVKYRGVETYGDVKSFKTLAHPYDIRHDLDISSATDLSSSASANCYIVSETGLYKFRAVKGNGSESVGSVASASILWETFGTSTAPGLLDLIAGVCCEDGYIAFQTADVFKEGNAVIAAKDASGNILWSWHIWLTDQPQGQVYYNDAGTMMDRNLGATSATPGDVGALGLLYQWGRKDPFPGSSSISTSNDVSSTVSWPDAVQSDSNTGTMEYAVANPAAFISDKSYSDWYYTGDSSTDDTRWTTSETAKSIYDPCPAGWRVPDGGRNGVWSKAWGSSYSSYARLVYDSTNEGVDFSGIFGDASVIWYPASGDRRSDNASLRNVGDCGYYWSASPDSDAAYALAFTDYGSANPLYGYYRAPGFSVRCIRAIDEVSEP